MGYLIVWNRKGPAPGTVPFAEGKGGLSPLAEATVPFKGVRPLYGAVNVIATKFAVSVVESSSNDPRAVSVVMVELVFSRAFTRATYTPKSTYISSRRATETANTRRLIVSGTIVVGEAKV